MNITFEELRAIKHRLPTGSVRRIAEELKIDEQTVRNYFGANKFAHGDIADKHIQPGPHGGIVHLVDTSILEAAQRIIAESEKQKEEVGDFFETIQKEPGAIATKAKEAEQYVEEIEKQNTALKDTLNEVEKIRLIPVKEKEKVRYEIDLENSPNLRFTPIPPKGQGFFMYQVDLEDSPNLRFIPIAVLEGKIADDKEAKLIIKSPGLGSIEDTIELLTKLENAYNRVFTFERLIKTTPKDVITNFDLKSISRLKPTEEHKLQIDKVSFSSPGYWQIIGQLNPLTQIREYLNELHERKKDRKYRDKYEEAKLEEEVKKMKSDNDNDSQRKELENKLLRNKLIKENIELLKAMGYTKEEIKALSLELLINPVIELDKLLEEQKVESFEVVEKDN